MKLLHGNSLELLKTLDANSIDAVVTDPPYATTQNKWDSLVSLVDFWKETERVCRPNAAIVIFCAQPFTTTLINSNLKNFKYMWHWEKTTPTGHLNAKKQPLRVIEDIAIFYKDQCFYSPQFTPGKPYTQKSGRQSDNWGSQTRVVTTNGGFRYPKNLLTFAKDRPSIHPTQKPVELLKYLIRTYCPPNGTVLDPFMGSGSTGVACKNLGFKFVGIELSQEYFEIAEKRIGLVDSNTLRSQD